MNGWTFSQDVAAMFAANPLLARLALVSLEVAVLAGAVALLIRLLRIRAPRVQALLWLLVVAKPVVGLAIGAPIPLVRFPSVAAPGPVGPETTSVPGTMRVAVDGEAFPATAAPGRNSGPTASAPPGVSTHNPSAEATVSNSSIFGPAAFGNLIVGVWLLGVAAFAGLTLRDRIRVRRLQRSATAASGTLRRRFKELAGAIGLKRTPELLITEALESPALAGIVRPAVLLPQWLADSANPQRLQWLLRHELMHRKLLDPVALGVRRLAEMLFFFHPAVWWAGRQWEEAMELACDRALLQTDTDAPAYAEQLYHVLDHQRARRRLAFGGGLFATRTQIGKRIAALLADPIRSPARLSAASVAGLALAALLSLPVGCDLQRSEAGDARDEEKAATETDATEGALRVVIPSAANGGSSPGGSPLQHTADFVFDRDVPVQLEATTMGEDWAVRVAWVRFVEDDSTVRADVRVIRKTVADAKWKVEIALWKADGDTVAQAESTFETQRMFLGYPGFFEHDLRLPLGAKALVDDATRFRIRLMQAPDDAPVTAQMAARPGYDRPTGECSLDIRVLDGRGKAVRAEVTVWRPKDEIPPVEWRSALFGPRIEWHAPDGRTWTPFGHYGGAATIRDLPPGEYRLSATSSDPPRTGDPTPMAVSEPFHLDESHKKHRATPRLEGECALTIEILDATTSDPIAREPLLLFRSDGLPVGDGSSGFWLRADENGLVRFGGLTPGTYQLEVGRRGWWTGLRFPPLGTNPIAVEVAPDKENRVEVVRSGPRPVAPENEAKTRDNPLGLSEAVRRQFAAVGDAFRTVRVAVATYVVDHESMPERPGDLTAPIPYIKAIPDDPFGSGPVRVVLDAQRPFVASVGPDGDWDGGKPIDMAAADLNGDVLALLSRSGKPGPPQNPEAIERYLRGERAAAPRAETLSPAEPGTPDPERPNIVWGEEVNGMRAALELVPEKQSYEIGVPIGIRMRVRNVSKRKIAFTSAKMGQRQAKVVDAEGRRIATGHSWYSGRVIRVRHVLKPGEEAVLQNMALCFGQAEQDAPGARQLVGCTVHVKNPGRYFVRYALSLPEATTRGEDGRVEGTDEWEGVLNTGVREIIVTAKPEPARERDTHPPAVW